MRLLEDTFKMFKGFKNISVIDGKNYGYVTYDSLDSATRAINVSFKTSIQIYSRILLTTSKLKIQLFH